MKKYLTVCAAMLLSACASDTLFPNTDKIVSTPAAEKVQISGHTGTLVGQKVGGFKNELNQIRSALNEDGARLEKIRSNIANNAVKYYEIVASMESKLQLGTTPSNPKMVALLKNAQNVLQETDTSSEELNNLAAEIAAMGTKTASLAGNIRATYAVPGAVDEDHANLRVLENGAEQTAVAAKNLLNEVATDALLQQQASQNGRQQLFRLNDAVARGSFGVDNAPLSTYRPAFARKAIQAKALNPAMVKNAPLFKINFASEDVQYRDALDAAVNNALKMKPNAKFEVIALNPIKNKNVSISDSKKYAAQVFADMIAMGVGPEDIMLSSKANGAIKTPEVLVFVK